MQVSAAPLTPPGRGRPGGQAFVEFALISVVAMLILVGAIQFALLGQVALSVSQVTYQATRYAALNPSSDGAALKTYVLSIAPSTLTTNSGGDLSIAVLQPPPRAFTSPVTVTVTYNTQSKIFVSNPFFGVKLPASLATTDTALTEGSN